MPLETQDGNTAGSASAGSTTSGQSTAAASSQQSSGQQTSQPGQAGQSGAATGGQQTQQNGDGQAQAGQTGSGAGSGQTATDDRSNWHPPHVNRRLSRENQQLKQQFQQLQRQVAALTGIEVPAQQPTRRLPQGVTQEQIEEARAQFALVYPELAELTSEEITAMRNFLRTGLPASEEVHKRFYRQLGAQTLQNLSTEAKSLRLSEAGTRRLMNAFHYELQTNEEFFDRWENGDPTLVSEFITAYKADLGIAAPAASSSLVRSRTLPRGGGSSSVVPPGQSGEPQLDPNDPDAVHKRAFRRMRARNEANQPSA